MVKKKRGRKPGVKVGPYKKTTINSTDITESVNALRILIQKRINYLNKLLKDLK